MASARIFNESIEIVGRQEYIDQVAKALELLQRKSPDAYAKVKKYVLRIKEVERYEENGMRADEDPPTFYMDTKEAFCRENDSDFCVQWCAGSIVHDAYHSQLYHDYREEHGSVPPYHVWQGEKAEGLCLERQKAICCELGASDELLKFLDQVIKCRYWEKRWLSYVVGKEQGNTGAVAILAALNRVISAAAEVPVTPLGVRSGIRLAARMLSPVLVALEGRLDPAQIDLSQLFVKSPTELLKEQGISPAEIEQILEGQGSSPSESDQIREGRGMSPAEIDQIKAIAGKERGNTGAAELLSTLNRIMSAAAEVPVMPLGVRSGLRQAAGLLPPVLVALEAPLDHLVVTSPTEILKEGGISAAEIDRIIHKQDGPHRAGSG
jgi:hypothetical protein